MTGQQAQEHTPPTTVEIDLTSLATHYGLLDPSPSYSAAIDAIERLEKDRLTQRPEADREEDIETVGDYTELLKRSGRLLGWALLVAAIQQAHGGKDTTLAEELEKLTAFLGTGAQRAGSSADAIQLLAQQAVRIWSAAAALGDPPELEIGGVGAWREWAEGCVKDIRDHVKRDPQTIRRTAWTDWFERMAEYQQGHRPGPPTLDIVLYNRRPDGARLALPLDLCEADAGTWSRLLVDSLHDAAETDPDYWPMWGAIPALSALGFGGEKALADSIDPGAVLQTRRARLAGLDPRQIVQGVVGQATEGGFGLDPGRWKFSKRAAPTSDDEPRRLLPKESRGELAAGSHAALVIIDPQAGTLARSRTATDGAAMAVTFEDAMKVLETWPLSRIPGFSALTDLVFEGPGDPERSQAILTALTHSRPDDARPIRTWQTAPASNEAGPAFRTIPQAGDLDQVLAHIAQAGATASVFERALGTRLSELPAWFLSFLLARPRRLAGRVTVAYSGGLLNPVARLLTIPRFVRRSGRGSVLLDVDYTAEDDGNESIAIWKLGPAGTLHNRPPLSVPGESGESTNLTEAFLASEPLREERETQLVVGLDNQLLLTAHRARGLFSPVYVIDVIAKKGEVTLRGIGRWLFFSLARFSLTIRQATRDVWLVSGGLRVGRRKMLTIEPSRVSTDPDAVPREKA